MEHQRDARRVLVPVAWLTSSLVGGRAAVGADAPGAKTSFTATELVDGYERALAPLARVTYWEESRYLETVNGEPKRHDEVAYGEEDGEGRVTVRTHYRRDGARLDMLALRDGVRPGPDVWREPEKHLSRTIVNGTPTILHYHPVTHKMGEASASRQAVDARKLRARTILPPAVRRRLRDAGRLRLRAGRQVPARDPPRRQGPARPPQLERVEGHAAYVLECTDKDAGYKYEVAIDPAAEFHPRRIVQARLDPAADGSDDTIDEVRIDKAGERFVPVAAHSKATYRAGADFLKTHDAHLRRSEVNFDPDFEAIRAFELLVPRGAIVSNHDDPLPGGRWKVVDGEFVLISRDPP